MIPPPTPVPSVSMSAFFFAPCRARQRFSDDGAVGVVCNAYRQAEPLGQSAGKRRTPPVQVARMQHFAGLGVDAARCADAGRRKRVNVETGIRNNALCQACHVGNHRVKAPRQRIGWRACAANHLESAVYKADLEGGAAKIDAQTVFHIEFSRKDNALRR